MREKLFAILLLIMTGFSALFSQGGYSVGMKAGLSLANQSYRITPIDYSLDTEPVLGPAISFFAEAFRGTHFSVQADISYATKGSSSKVTSVSVNHLNNDQVAVNEGEQSTSKFKYISIAPMARYRMGQSSLHPYFLLGPRLDILLDYSTNSDYPLDSQSGVTFGLSCGAGLEYVIKGTGLFTELQYQPDLSPVTNEEPLLINNNMISIAVGIRWLVSE